MRTKSSVAVVIAACAFGTAGAADLDVKLDARDVARRHLRADVSMPAKPGPLTLVFAKWIPGEHGPTGPVNAIVGMELRAGGQPLAWTRDPLDPYAIRVTVPKGASRLDVALDCGLPVEGGAFSGGPTTSADLAVVSWNHCLVFPKGVDGATFTTQASFVPPAGWTAATALATTPAADGVLRLEPATLATLVDSPVQMGRLAKRVDVPVRAGVPAHSISLMADETTALELPADFAAGYGNLVDEAGAAFGSRPYRHYTWLVTLSDEVEHFGLEHHESSDNRTVLDILSTPEGRMSLAELLAHEYTHAWNGKYRRPAGLLSPDYQKPMDATDLWVYEGMTEFWGYVLPPRAGLMTPAMFRDLLAMITADFEYSPGTKWRPMGDTATAAQLLYVAPSAWTSSRRSVDFYDAGVFLWLDVDAELRARSGGRATLDDFTRRFLAGPTGSPQLKPYAEDEVYATLAAVGGGTAADWRGVIRPHLDRTGTGALIASLERSGWKLEYTTEPNAWLKAREKRGKNVYRRWSLGLDLNKDGVVTDVVEGGPAARAGVGPGMKLIAVGGRKYTAERLDAAIAATKDRTEPLALVVENGDAVQALAVDYRGGARFPHLVRIDGRPDTLSEVIAARVK